MLNINFPKIDKKTFNDLELSLAEEKIKINIRGKSKDFFTKVGKLSLKIPILSSCIYFIIINFYSF